MALRLTANRRYPTVPAIGVTVENHTAALQAVKEALEISQRRTPDILNSHIRVQDLIDLGLITFEGNTTAIVGADLSEIAEIGDLSGAALNDFLRFDGSQWVNDQLSTTDITQVMVTQHQAALSIAYSQLTGTPPLTTATLLTMNDETSAFTASRRLTAGTNVTFDESTPGQLVVNVSIALYLDDLLDVDALYPNVGDVLTWDGYGWVAQPPA